MRRSLLLTLTLFCAGAACSDDGATDGGEIDAAAVDASESPTDAAAADAAPVPDAAPPREVTFTRHVVDTDVAGAAFVEVADVDGDQQLDLVVSSFGTLAGPVIPPGEVRVYNRNGGLDDWSYSSVVAEADNIAFPNMTTVVDVDGDLDMDVIVPSGFLACALFGPGCGRLAWYEQTPGGWVPHEIIAGGSDLFYHRGVVADFDGDNIADLITVGEELPPPLTGRPSRAEVQWFKGTGAGFESREFVVGAGMGSFPRVHDVDGDDDLDIISAEYFHPDGSFAWFERTADPSPGAPAGEFTRRVIDDTVGPAVMLTLVEDLYGDGVLRAVGSNHTNTQATEPDPWESAVFVYDLPANPTQTWPRTQISEGIVSGPGSVFAPQAAPGIFGVGDIDGDGDKDIALSGDGDPRVFWLEQTDAGSFTTHVLEDPLGQAGGMGVVNLDGDGKNEIVVTGYEDNVLYIYERDDDIGS